MAGLVAAKVGASVTLSDFPTADMCSVNVELNNMQNCVDVQVLKWGVITSFLEKIAPKINIILGSDTFYDSKGNF